MALNRGEVSPLALARTDLEKLRLAAQSMVNWMPRTVGPMTFRPGTEFIGEVLNDLPCEYIEFVAAFADTALLELTNNTMRVWINEALMTRLAVGTIIPAFGGSWALTATGTATASVGGGNLTFGAVNAGALATAIATVSVAAPDRATEHALRIVVENGPVNFQIGSTSGGVDLFPVETLDAGIYSLAFTPGAGTATIYIQFSSTSSAENYNTTSKTQPTALQQVQVTSIALEAPGVFNIPAPWPQSVLGWDGAKVQPSQLRHTQSGDVIYVACAGYPQYEIVRLNGPHSWAIVNYRPVKGPMAPFAAQPAISITPSSLNGNITLTASSALFKTQDVGTLWRLFQNGQNVDQTLSSVDTYTDTVQVEGVSSYSNINGGGMVVDANCTDRDLYITTTGTWVGTLSLQRSFEGPTSGFTDYQKYTSNQTATLVRDGLNNEIIWYRLGFESGNYTSGSVLCGLNYAGGGGYGVAHITGYVSNTVVNAEVLVPFYDISATNDWRQSEWSNFEGWPTATELHEGRLWWSGADRWWGSSSNDYTNFDWDAIGEAALIDQSIGKGPIANINWMLSLDHLLAGADTSIIAALSDAINSPLTPTNFNLKQSVTNGAFPIQAYRVDQRAIYIDQSGARLYQLIYDIGLYNYRPSDLTRFNREIGLPGFIAMRVQRQPDTRINMVRADGVLVSFVFDIEDEVEAFWKVQTPNGVIEKIMVLPGAIEDQVYVVVNRQIGGVTKRYLEKFARIDECLGAAINKNVDAMLVYGPNGPAAATNILSGFNHLVGQTVSIWGNTGTVIDDLGTAVVSNTGTVTIPNNQFNEEVTVVQAVVGLPYSSEFISAKLAYAAQMGSAINQVKRVDHIGFVLASTHYQGIKYGKYTPTDPTVTVSGLFSVPEVLDALPQVEDGAVTPPGTIWQQYDKKAMEFPGDADTDVRLYIQASSPKPATVAAISFQLETSN
jgi:hypothetical protein